MEQSEIPCMNGMQTVHDQFRIPMLQQTPSQIAGIDLKIFAPKSGFDRDFPETGCRKPKFIGFIIDHFTRSVQQFAVSLCSSQKDMCIQKETHVQVPCP